MSFLEVGPENSYIMDPKMSARHSIGIQQIVIGLILSVHLIDFTLINCQIYIDNGVANPLNVGSKSG